MRTYDNIGGWLPLVLWSTAIVGGTILRGAEVHGGDPQPAAVPSKQEDAAPPAPTPGMFVPEGKLVAGRWSNGPDVKLESKDKKLLLTAMTDEPYVLTQQTPAAKGKLTLLVRMQSNSMGEGQLFWSEEGKGPAFGPERVVAFVPEHDGKWHTVEIPFEPKSLLTGLKLQPSAAPGEIRVESIRLAISGGQSLHEWKFDGSNAPVRKWTTHDIHRPKPEIVDPGTASTLEQPGRPPSDAIVLFDGTDLSQWTSRKGNQTVDGLWKVEDGYMEIVAGTGTLTSKEKFGSAQIHLEWATPTVIKGRGQGRGNSGLKLNGFGEVQVLDSYENETYADGQAASLYGRFPPLVNVSRKPGEWQTYDIIVELARVDEQKKVTAPARITVFHNGVLVHHAIECGNIQGETNLSLQDHGNPVRYRNIWVRRLKGYRE